MYDPHKYLFRSKCRLPTSFRIKRGQESLFDIQRKNWFWKLKKIILLKLFTFQSRINHVWVKQKYFLNLYLIKIMFEACAFRFREILTLKQMMSYFEDKNFSIFILTFILSLVWRIKEKKNSNNIRNIEDKNRRIFKTTETTTPLLHSHNKWRLIY